MTVSKQYHLNFKQIIVGNRASPIIVNDQDAQGSSLSIPLSNFLEFSGPEHMRELIEEINDTQFTSSHTDGYVGSITDSTGEHIAKLFTSPNRISLQNQGSFDEIPVNDFIAILAEWRSFLLSLPKGHFLSDK